MAVSTTPLSSKQQRRHLRVVLNSGCSRGFVPIMRHEAPTGSATEGFTCSAPATSHSQYSGASERDTLSRASGAQEEAGYNGTVTASE